MAVISVIGAPSVGKSFLVRQLACKNCLPVFFEGESGIFPKKVLKYLNGEKDTKERYRWILARYKKSLENARKISDSGIDCYVDGDILTFEAWLDAEIGDKSPAVLIEWLEENQYLRADKVIALIVSEEKIKDNILGRGRSYEQSNFIYERALRIQKGCVEVAKKYKHVILVDKNNLDFTDEKKLSRLEKKIKNTEPLNREKE